MSDDEGAEEEDEADYTYNELMLVVSRATVFLREKYAKEGEDGLPDTRDELVTIIEPHCTVKALCNNPNTFDKLREIPKLDQQLVLENLLARLNEEDEKANMKLSTREVLLHLVELSKQKHAI